MPLLFGSDNFLHDFTQIYSFFFSLCVCVFCFFFLKNTLRMSFVFFLGIQNLIEASGETMEIEYIFYYLFLIKSKILKHYKSQQSREKYCFLLKHWLECKIRIHFHDTNLNISEFSGWNNEFYSKCLQFLILISSNEFIFHLPMFQSSIWIMSILNCFNFT